METAIIEMNFIPPGTTGLPPIPWGPPDIGFYVYHIRYVNGSVRIGGTSRGSDESRAILKALCAAREAGFTHWILKDKVGLSRPL